MWKWLRSLFGGKRQIAARYDAARTTDDNRRHWSNADALSSRLANSLSVRQTLRNRSRYEFDNNGYAEGAVLTLADHTVGLGPRVHLIGDDPRNALVALRWREWADEVGLMPNLHTADQAKTRDGESFFVLTNHEPLDSPVKLFPKLLECDQVSSPYTTQQLIDPSHWVDGIELDDVGRPANYHILKYHPGDYLIPGAYGIWDKVSAQSVIHWFRRDRPNQYRGIPELTASLPLFAQLRRFTLATITAAETAADFAAVLETELPPDGATDEPTPFSTIEIDKGMMVTLPEGNKLHQLESKHPATTYEMFKREILKEIGRPLNMPFNVIAGDSSTYNYSSARLDKLLYYGSILVRRGGCTRVVLEPLFAAWYAEARLIPGYLPAGMPDIVPNHVWYWPSFPTIDPLKESQADTARLQNGTATLAGLLAEDGIDWEAHLAQRAAEVQRMEELGLPVMPPVAAPPVENPVNNGN